ncbi:MAG: hypothetical protein N4A33_03830 [Bacteriovoracaceae bacterium]|jgi:hypothetical protein|nr:hypothetical protein [Bacteriovoracaceae bacterium]
MKKMLFGLLLIISTSTFANNYICKTNEGSIINFNIIDNNKVKVVLEKDKGDIENSEVINAWGSTFTGQFVKRKGNRVKVTVMSVGLLAYHLKFNTKTLVLKYQSGWKSLAQKVHLKTKCEKN